MSRHAQSARLQNLGYSCRAVLVYSFGLRVLPMLGQVGIGNSMLDAIDGEFRRLGFRLAAHFLSVSQHKRDAAYSWSRMAHYAFRRMKPWLSQFRMPGSTERSAVT